MILAFLLLAVSASLTGSVAYTPPLEEVALVRDRMTQLQHLSFATNREYCGYLGRTDTGSLVFTDIVRGGRDGCTPVMPEYGLTLIASIHTHGAYDPDVPAEFPTTLDMESDAVEGVSGYVSTPGGRLWFINPEAGLAVQLCGLNCLPQDSGFRAGDDGLIARRYSYDQLQAIEAQ